MKDFSQILESPEHRQLITLDKTHLESTSLPTYNSYLHQFFTWAEIKDEIEFLKVPKDILQVALEEFVKHLNKRVKADQISPNSVPKLFKPMKLLLEVNYRENDIAWNRISTQYPPKEKTSGGKPWTTDQVRIMLEHCYNTRERAAIHLHACTGCRVGIHDHPLLMKHLISMDDPNGNKCYGILVYAEESETILEKDTDLITGKRDNFAYSHFVFLTPEATIALDEYLQYRVKRGETLEDDSPIFSSARKDKPGGAYFQFTRNSFQKMFQRVLKRTPITRTKKRNRFDIMIDHGFRKRFNTILKINNNVNSNIAEKLMQHKKGLDGSYLTPTREECFTEFVKAIVELTISSKERDRLAIQLKDAKIDELTKKSKRIDDLEDQMLQLRDKKSVEPKETQRELIERILIEKKII